MPTHKNEQDDLVEHLETAAENAGRCARKIFDQSTGGTDALTFAIREEPVKAALVALGVGFLIGALIRR